MAHQESRSPQHDPSRLYADVIVPRHIAKSFTYLVPAPLAPTIAVGQRVLIPFGRTTLEGAVIALSRSIPAGVHAAHLKEIRSVADAASDLSPALFDLSRRVADEYLAPWGQCLRLILPPGRPSTDPPQRYIPTEAGRAALKSEACPERLKPLLARIARRSTGVLASTLAGTRKSKIREDLSTLESNGWIATSAHTRPTASSAKRRTNAAPEQDNGLALPRQATSRPTLPAPDTAWIHRVDGLLRAGTADRLLVHAPWEQRLGLLLHTVQHAHAAGKSVLILVGEVARAEWLAHLLTADTTLPVTLLHSELDEAVWRIRWNEIQTGASTIVVGTRSAVFAPLRSIGAIWIEGEDDPALKEPQEPRYHAREAAWMRAQAERALLVLGSSHPSLESYWSAWPSALQLPDASSRRAAVEVVDLRHEPGRAVFSASLLTAMRETLARNDRVLLFLNRKGFAGALVCRECSWVPRCQTCAVALHYSRHTARLTCRYCGTVTPPPDACPTCGGTRLAPVGEGTERVEAEATRLFPGARIVRLDGDTLRTPAAARTLWEQAASGAWDVLIGTQALVRREPLPPVGLAGIVHADSGLHIPDFRAAERTYQILSDVVALARPAAEGGRVILQTLLPVHHVMHSLADGNPARFYDEELAARQLLGYPPVLHLINLTVSGKDAPVVEQTARQLAKHLATAPDRLTILGPVPAAGGRPRGQARQQLMVKGQDRTFLHQAVQTAVKTVEGSNSGRRVKITVDVDPIEMN